MDPLSATASLLTLIYAARFGIQGIRKLVACRKAPVELDQLRNELESLESLLEKIRLCVEQLPSTVYRDLLRAPVTLASEKIDSINKILCSPVFGGPYLNEGNKARLVWLRYKRRLMVLLD